MVVRNSPSIPIPVSRTDKNKKFSPDTGVIPSRFTKSPVSAPNNSDNSLIPQAW